MDLFLTERNRRYRDIARELARTVLAPRAAELDRSGEHDPAIMQAITDAGLAGLWIPEEYGGKGAGFFPLCLVVEELSRICGGIGVVYAVNALGSLTILNHGTTAQKERYLPPVASGEQMTAFALSETEAGSDAGSLATEAVTDGDGFRITGDKKWTTNAGVANLFTVFAKTDPRRGTRGTSAFIVERTAEGFTIGKREDLMGIRCVSVHETHFRNTPVASDQLLGERPGLGFLQAMKTLDYGRPGVAAQAVGIAQGALDLALEHARKRQQFGQNIGSFQGIQFMLADMATRVEAARHLVYTTARALDAGARNAGRLSAMTKLYASDIAMQVTTDAVQIFGGFGYCRDYPIERFMRDAKITQIYEGTNQVQRMVIARSLLRDGYA